MGASMPKANTLIYFDNNTNVQAFRIMEVFHFRRRMDMEAIDGRKEESIDFN